MARLGRSIRRTFVPPAVPLILPGTAYQYDLASTVPLLGELVGAIGARKPSTITPVGVAKLATTIAVPIADVANVGGWIRAGGGSSPLYADIDEGVTTDEGDYIKSPVNPATATCEVRLRGMIIPPGIDIVLRARRL